LPEKGQIPLERVLPSTTKSLKLLGEINKTGSAVFPSK